MMKPLTNGTSSQMFELCFEFGDYRHLPNSMKRKELEGSLNEVWRNRFFPYAEYHEDNDETPSVQPFLQFDGENFRPKNYIGFISSNEDTIEIFPKVFSRSNLSKEQMLRQIFYWLSYCRRLRFPFLNSELSEMQAESLPELLIYIFAHHCRETVSSFPYNRYEEVHEVLYQPKGRIDFSAYANKQLAYGNFHRLECLYEPFVFDNLLNRTIKYVCRILKNRSRFFESQRLLDQVIFIMDEVEDATCTVADLNKIQLTPFFSDYQPIITFCRHILEQRIYSSASYDLSQWSLLLPMEYVFEDFFSGFLEKHFSRKYKVEPQKSDLCLTSEGIFNLQHDILLTDIKLGKQIIIDTKYKPRWELEAADKKQGVSQTDMYQMVSYSYRRGCKQVIMIYPNTSDTLSEPIKFHVHSASSQDIIEIIITEIPFWSEKPVIEIEVLLTQYLTKLFEDLH